MTPIKPHRYSDKIHCFQCGRMRQGSLSFLTEVPNKEDASKMDLVAFNLNIRNFNKISKTKKEVELPTKLFGECVICKTKTFYNLNKNRKLEVVDM